MRSKVDVDPSNLTRLIVNGKQAIFENDVHWSRIYLAKAGLIVLPKHGQWALTIERGTDQSVCRRVDVYYFAGLDGGH